MTYEGHSMSSKTTCSSIKNKLTTLFRIVSEIRRFSDRNREFLPPVRDYQSAAIAITTVLIFRRSVAQGCTFLAHNWRVWRIV